MTTNSNYVNISVVAGADLSAKQNTFVKVNSSGQAVSAAAGEAAIGVLSNKPASGQTASIQVFGVAKVLAGATIAAGARVAADADGKGVTATAGRTNTSDAGASADALIGSNAMGIALTGGVSGDVISVLITNAGAVPTTVA
jgi:hypothetical protein